MQDALRILGPLLDHLLRKPTHPIECGLLAPLRDLLGRNSQRDPDAGIMVQFATTTLLGFVRLVLMCLHGTCLDQRCTDDGKLSRSGDAVENNRRDENLKPNFGFRISP